MTSKRKFYKTTLQVEILSEELLKLDDLRVEIEEAMFGDNSMIWSVVSEETMTGSKIVEALYSQGSDPEFFMLDEDGNDTKDNYEEDNGGI